MNLAEALYIGDNIKVNNNQTTIIDDNITQIQILEAITILTKQLQFIQNKCGKHPDNCGKKLVVIQ